MVERIQMPSADRTRKTNMGELPFWTGSVERVHPYGRQMARAGCGSCTPKKRSRFLRRFFQFCVAIVVVFERYHVCVLTSRKLHTAYFFANTVVTSVHNRVIVYRKVCHLRRWGKVGVRQYCNAKHESDSIKTTQSKSVFHWDSWVLPSMARREARRCDYARVKCFT